MKLNIDIRKFEKSTKGSSWQKAVLLSLVAGSIIIALSYAYLTFRPLSNDIKNLIDEEISSTNINFDQRIIDSIKERQKPADLKQPSSGKNPFAGF